MEIKIKRIVDNNVLDRLTHTQTIQLPFKELDKEKDHRWNVKKVNAELLQAFEGGESIEEMSERLIRVTDMNEAAAIRNARTMTTSFENLGRIDGMKAMQENGIIVKKKWWTTQDKKAREWHRELSGQIAELDEPFINHPPIGKKRESEEIMYPADPNASAANVYNCRCTMTAVVEGFEPTLPKGTVKVIKTDISKLRDTIEK